MRLSILTGLFLALLPLPVTAQDATPAFSAERVRADIEYLADDRLEGRRAGTPGYDAAARHVADQFATIGLEPGGAAGSWFQPVTLADLRLDPAKPATMTVGGKSFANTADVLINATPRGGTGTQSVSAGAVFVGYGLDAPDLGHRDYDGVDLTGKFAVMLADLPEGLPEERSGALADERSRMACDHGAIGVIYLVAPGYLQHASWQVRTGYFLQPQTIWLTPEGMRGEIDPRLQSGGFARGKAAAALFEGAPMRTAQIFADAAKSRPLRSFALPTQVTFTRTSIVTTARSANVVGLLRGSDPALAAESVLLTAHLDHEGIDPKLKGDKIYNGAMDNAAGVATLLEAARAFVASGQRPRRSILFVALTGEERGLLGSEYLARYPVPAGIRPVADVNLDMPILLYDFQDVVAYGAEHSTMGAIVAAAGAKMGVSVTPDPMPEEDFFTRSDHYSFVKAGVPSVFLMTGVKNGGAKAFRDFLATHYHQPSDQADQGLNWAAGAKFARLNYLIAREIADADEPPRWYEGDPYGARYAPDAPKAPAP